MNKQPTTNTRIPHKNSGRYDFTLEIWLHLGDEETCIHEIPVTLILGDQMELANPFPGYQAQETPGLTTLVGQLPTGNKGMHYAVLVANGDTSTGFDCEFHGALWQAAAEYMEDGEKIQEYMIYRPSQYQQGGIGV